MKAKYETVEGKSISYKSYEHGNFLGVGVLTSQPLQPQVLKSQVPFNPGSHLPPPALRGPGLRISR